MSYGSHQLWIHSILKSTPQNCTTFEDSQFTLFSGPNCLKPVQTSFATTHVFYYNFSFANLMKNTGSQTYSNSRRYITPDVAMHCNLPPNNEIKYYLACIYLKNMIIHQNDTSILFDNKYAQECSTFYVPKKI